VSGAPVPSSRDAFPLGGDLEVSRLGFGAMAIGRVDYDPGSAGSAGPASLLRRLPGLGIRLIDTADVYGPHTSEEWIARALRPYPEGLVIATKAGLVRSPEGQLRPDGRPEHLRAACEGSLKRLGLDRLDLLQLHRIDPAVPRADQFGTLRELQIEGKVRHTGLCNVTVADIEEARQSMTVTSVQNRYNLYDRRADDVLEYCEREGIALLAWAPLGDGVAAIDRRLGRIARRHGTTATRLALAWLLHRSPVLLPIPGTTRIEHLEDNAAAMAIRLDPGVADRLSHRFGGGRLGFLPAPARALLRRIRPR
jgi:pyridoxine 4-dehydrogenase